MAERTFKAARFDEALALVKKELGPDAVIVSSRQIPGSPIMGKKTEVEVRALPSEEAPQRMARLRPLLGAPTGLFERRLVRQGVPESVAKALATHVHRALGREPSSMREARDPLRAALEIEFVFSDPSILNSRVIALVGPTGVGKTTTIAKMAAEAALVVGKAVGLIGIDQYRIAGAEQLEQYADLIGIPMELAHDAASFEIALRKLGDAELIFVDTAGRSPRDIGALGAMSECLHSAQETVEVQLCVPASQSEDDLRATIERHQILRPTKLVATKMDEAVYHGRIIAAALFSALPLAYFTTGQRVPEDIEVACSHRLASLLCGEELH